MSNDEFVKHLTESLKDELHDVIKYAEMSKKMHTGGYAQIFRDMAHEEHQHAHHIKDIISDMGVALPNKDEINILMEKADKALKEM